MGIVGILSAVALPNFPNQTGKAKGTEATTKLSALLKEAHSEALGDTAASALTLRKTKSGPIDTASATGDWDYTMDSGSAKADDIVATAKPKKDSAADGITDFQGCVDIKTGAIEIKQQDAALTGC